jgi:anti-sigma factor RsiW
MCNSSEHLIAWMDGELPDQEAAAVERHVGGCAECRASVASYDRASRGFAAYYDAVTQGAIEPKPRRRLPLWVPALVAATVAAVLLIALFPRSAKPVPVVMPVAEIRPPVVTPAAEKPLRPVARHHVVAHKKAPAAGWNVTEPAIQIAIPAEAMFPPGAVPDGVNYVASLSLADGSVQGLRLQP